MTQKTPTVTSIPEDHLCDVPCEGSPTTLDVFKQIVQIIKRIK